MPNNTNIGSSPNMAQLQHDRKQLLDMFKVSGMLHLTHEWFMHANDLLTVLYRHTSSLASAETPYEAVLRTQTLRMQRYLRALSQLSVIEGKTIRHCIDGYHPVLKSLFENVVECELVVLYKALFGAQPSWAIALERRIVDYANAAAKKRNFTFHHREDLVAQLQEMRHRGLNPSPLIEQYAREGKATARAEATSAAQDLHGAGAMISDVKHWFPVVDTENNYFSINENARDQRPRNVGSMQWRCQAVLGSRLADRLRAKWWHDAYDADYEMLNRYSHPALGYDDNLRPQEERFVDLFRLQFGAMTVLTNWVIPTVTDQLRLRTGAVPELDKFRGTVDELHERAVRDGLPLLMLIDQTDYLPTNVRTS
jgi:hypothetical protein